MKIEEFNERRKQLMRRVGTLSVTLNRTSKERREAAPNTLGFLVRCLDVRQSFGRIDVLVEPIHGTGMDWVQEDKIEWRT